MTEFLITGVGAGLIAYLSMDLDSYWKGMITGVLATIFMAITGISGLRDNRSLMEGSVKQLCTHSAKPARCQELMCIK